MKKMTYYLVGMTLLALLSGCGQEGAVVRNMAQENSIDAILNVTESQESMETVENPEIESASQTSEEVERSDKEDAADQEDAADVDLTQMSATMVYTEVFGMFSTPDAYRGKKVKMEGELSVYQDPGTGKVYFACIVKDATACCAQGLEFVLTEDYVYPEDYPNPGETITVLGLFDTYMEGEYMYCTLKDSVLL